MSYNIDLVEIVHKRGFSITTEALKALLEKGFDFPEIGIDDPGWLDNTEIRDGRIHPKVFWWTGEGSGRSLPTLKRVLSSFDGDADLVLIWEGGDSVDGLRLRDHVVTSHKVIMSLGDEV